MKDEISAMAQRRARLEDKLRRELGPTVLAALANPKVVEVMLNADGRLWIDEFGVGMRDSGATMSPTRAESLLGTIAVALNTTINADRPLIEAELPINGSRIGGAIPPVVASTVFSIRKRATCVFTLSDYVNAGNLTASHAEALRVAVGARQNILIAGSTGSGKTTFANALLHEISAQSGPHERIVILEETPELQCTAPNRVELKTTECVDMTKLLRMTMRLRPDRIVVGEVRGGEALALLKAWNTGHPGGIATIHANSCKASLDRLEQLLQEATATRLSRLVSEAVHVIAHLSRTREGRRVGELAAVVGWQADTGYSLRTIQ